MNEQELKELWLEEEAQAHIRGWDFSHIAGRYTEEEDLPWDYRAIVLHELNPSAELLDIDTGGGEFLLSLNHPAARTAATEGYAPNVALCREKLLPLGIGFREMRDHSRMPFGDARFDIVINRHGDYNVSELRRVLKSGGLFVTQQVGDENDRELAELLLPGTPKPFHGLNAAAQWARWSGLPGSSSGSFRASRWILASSGCWRRKKESMNAAPSRAAFTDI